MIHVVHSKITAVSGLNIIKRISVQSASELPILLLYEMSGFRFPFCLSLLFVSQLCSTFIRTVSLWNSLSPQQWICLCFVLFVSNAALYSSLLICVPTAEKQLSRWLENGLVKNVVAAIQRINSIVQANLEMKITEWLYDFLFTTLLLFNTLVPSLQTFTTRLCHATSTNSNHPYFPCVPNVRKTFHSAFFKNCYIVGQTPM